MNCSPHYHLYPVYKEGGGGHSQYQTHWLEGVIYLSIHTQLEGVIYLSIHTWLTQLLCIYTTHPVLDSPSHKIWSCFCFVEVLSTLWMHVLHTDILKDYFASIQAMALLSMKKSQTGYLFLKWPAMNIILNKIDIWWVRYNISTMQTE